MSKVYKCDSCGAVLKIFPGCSSVRCDYCNSVNYIGNIMVNQKIKKQYIVILEIIGNNAKISVIGTNNSRELIVPVHELYSYYLDDKISLDLLSQTKLCKALNISIDELEREYLTHKYNLYPPEQSLGEFFSELEKNMSI